MPSSLQLHFIENVRTCPVQTYKSLSRLFKLSQKKDQATVKKPPASGVSRSKAILRPCSRRGSSANTSPLEAATTTNKRGMVVAIPPLLRLALTSPNNTAPLKQETYHIPRRRTTGGNPHSTLIPDRDWDKIWLLTMQASNSPLSTVPILAYLKDTAQEAIVVEFRRFRTALQLPPLTKAVLLATLRTIRTHPIGQLSHRPPSPISAFTQGHVIVGAEHKVA
ncbi:hypothetical protein C8R45DRAFT_939601 [Mycena sanguinolenta]|nr:hypothetical protein C8R45DRAFT_939601 [Mycena sanguinolenta]